VTGFVCRVKDENPDYLSACKNLDEYQSTEYCVLHCPDENKGYEFEQVRRSKLAQEDYDFSGTVFPYGSTNFSGATFGTNAVFIGTRFLDKADFSGAEFSGERTYFDNAEFSDWYTDFSEARFGAEMTSFSGTQFIGSVTFENAQFNGDTDFNEATFSGSWTEFSGAQFRKRIFFREAEFIGNVAFFTRAKFSGEWTDFSKAKFYVNTGFSEAQFGHDTHFLETLFGGEADFSEALFCGEATNFIKAKFDDKTNFGKAKFRGDEIHFSEARFGGETADFSETRFRGWFVNFSRAQFSEARTSFEEAKFANEVHFSGATFEKEVLFGGATFESKVDFDAVIFRGRVWFSGLDTFSPHTRVDFSGVQLGEPEEFHFNAVLLRPSWLVDMDSRNVDFTTVKWYGILVEKSLDSIQKELEALKHRGYHDNPYSPLTRACRRLSANMEENREYFLSNEFHYWSLDAWRIGSWSVVYEALLKEEARRDIEEREQRVIGFRDLWSPSNLNIRALFEKDTWSRNRDRGRVGVVNILYWVLSGYGVRAARALIVLLTLAGVFALLYMIVGHPSLRVVPITRIGQVLADVVRAVMYSLGVMARLRPEPVPAHMGLFQILVTIEGILGPLQIALLALAVRRKVMR
jgi:uncharacterized protein YjbI with pentapeptide repeats